MTQTQSAPTFRALAAEFNGVEDVDAKFYFENGEGALGVAREFGAKLTIPEWALARQWRVWRHRGWLVVAFARLDTDESLPGWRAKKQWHERVAVALTDQQQFDNFDDIETWLRYVVVDGPLGGQGIGFYIKNESGRWLPTGNFLTICVMMAHGVPKADCAAIMGALIGERSYKLVKIPFAPEYPGDRLWNLGAAQYTYTPANEAGPHPHWDMILKHCGQDLDDAIAQLEWAQQAGIKNGADYLLTWAACMLREPFEKLPYLFLWGDQNNGKSIYHEALALLMTKGVARADRALTNSNDFNGELADAVLAVIEEKDIAQTPGAYAKIKDWVTSLTLTIRKMRTDQFSVPNSLHFVQTANEKTACPIFGGDTRIVAIYVHPLAPGQEIPKELLLARLRDEAPQFMRTILDLQLPPMLGRLRLPVVENQTKQQLADESAGELAASIVQAMRDRTTWKGTAAELAELLGAGDWPKDRRGVKTQLSRAGAYLRSRGVAVDCDLPKTKTGYPVTITRK
jgi:hypothetical protein